MTGTDDDASLRLSALMWAMGYTNTLPWWKRPASPMPLAREMYEFVRAFREPAVLHSIPNGPGAA